MPLNNVRTNSRSIILKYGAIGDELELAEGVYLEWDKDGILSKVEAGNSAQDVPNEVALPCFINAHTHLGDSFAKDMGLNIRLEDLVAPPNSLKHRLLRATLPETICAGMIASLKTLLVTGTQVFGDFREGGVEGVQLLESVLGSSLPQGSIFARYLENVDELTPIVPFLAGYGMSSPNDYENSSMEIINRFCKKHKLLLAAHISETDGARATSSSSYGMSDVERILQYDAPKLLVHLTRASSRDLDQVFDARVPVVICPQSNAVLTGCLPPIEQFLQREIPFALGTDNVMVNSPNLWSEIQFGIKVQRMRSPDLPINPSQWLKAATINGARSLNIADKYGSLVVGKRANFCTVDLSSSNLIPSPKPIANVALRAGVEDVKRVFFNGNMVWKHG